MNAKNVDSQIAQYLLAVADLGGSLAGLRGVPLLGALKRTEIAAGPYPHVSFFEAANRVMTDLVLLYGVRWLLNCEQFPFSEYKIEYGHGNRNAFDIMAEEDGQSLVGEAFNVAPSFFQGKKAAMLNKLRRKENLATHSILMFNHDAMPDGYFSPTDSTVHYIFVHVGDGRADIISRKPPRQLKKNVGKIK